MGARTFGTVELTDLLPDSQGGIPVRTLGSLTPGGENILAVLEEGRSYPPGSHAYATMVMVLEGTGIFHLEQDTPYAPGSVFVVEARANHGFVRVDTPTLYIKQKWATRPPE